MNVAFGGKLEEVVNSDQFRILLSGEKNSGKTSLAFKLAYDHGAKGGRPLFICNKNKIESKVPLFVKVSESQSNSNWSSDVLSHIHMKYVSNVIELKALIAGLHCFEPCPSMIVIDDFSSFIDPLFSVPRHDPKFLEQCITLGAFLTDVITYFQKKNNVENPNNFEIKPFKLILTDDCQDSLYLNVMYRVTNTIFTLRRNTLNTVQMTLKDTISINNNHSLDHHIMRHDSSRGEGQSGGVVVYANIQCHNHVISLST